MKSEYLDLIKVEFVDSKPESVEIMVSAHYPLLVSMAICHKLNLWHIDKFSVNRYTNTLQKVELTEKRKGVCVTIKEKPCQTGVSKYAVEYVGQKYWHESLILPKRSKVS